MNKRLHQNKKTILSSIASYRRIVRSPLSSFTILEVTLVLAIMGVLVTIIAVASNRFQEQLKQTTIIQEELNHFYAIRSNLWTELYASDSVHVNQQILTIYQPKRNISYRIAADELERRENEGPWTNLKMPMVDINQTIENESKKIALIFDWKGEPMQLHYFCSTGTKEQIDHFFMNYKR
jgi:type II secretory pathway pseudopilin PulG